MAPSKTNSSLLLLIVISNICCFSNDIFLAAQAKSVVEPKHVVETQPQVASAANGTANESECTREAIESLLLPTTTNNTIDDTSNGNDNNDERDQKHRATKQYVRCIDLFGWRAKQQMEAANVTRVIDTGLGYSLDTLEHMIDAHNQVLAVSLSGGADEFIDNALGKLSVPASGLPEARAQFATQCAAWRRQAEADEHSLEPLRDSVDIELVRQLTGTAHFDYLRYVHYGRLCSTLLT